MNRTTQHDLADLLTCQLLGSGPGHCQVERDQVFQAVKVLADDRAGVIFVAQAGLHRQKEAAGRQGIGVDIDVSDVIDPFGDDFDFADPDLLHPGRAIQVVLEVKVDSGPADRHRLIVGDVDGCSRHARVGCRGVERQDRHGTAVVGRHAAVGRAEIHADDHRSPRESDHDTRKG